MERKRTVMKIVVAVLALVIVALAAGGVWYKTTHITVQESSVSKELTSLTITSLTEEDVLAMDALTALEEINAQGCRDYDQLLALGKRHPGCEIHYTVCLDGVEYPEDATEITLTALTQEELSLFSYLPLVTSVNAEGCTDYALLQQLREQLPECDISYTLPIGGEEYTADTTALELSGITEEDIAMIAYLPELETVHMVDPAAEAEALLQMVESRPEVAFTWEMEVLGVSVNSESTEVSFADMPLTGTDAISAGLAYFPAVEKVDMSGCGIDNETMAAFREEKRSEYKVVWTVQCGKLTVRTDETAFIPVKHSVYYFLDKDAYNLRYCEDMVALDIGHMAIKDLSFVEYMPNLKYLVLAHTTVLDLTPLSTCKNLVFLELDWTAVKDYEPLLGCTALEDLNLGLTYGDAEIIAQMTWLKNLWWKDAGYKRQVILEEALPNTNMKFNPSYTVANGWRELQNYYDMRDILGMHYMK